MGMQIAAGAAAAAGSMLGSIGSALLSAKAAKEMQKRQIEWERERAKSAHQWEVEDLKAAGLNPILSAGGEGAATGGISAPTVDTSGIANAGNQAVETINSAFGIEKTKQETKNAEETQQNIAADTELKQAQKEETVANTAVRMAEQGLIKRKTATEIIEQTKKQGEINKLRAETNKLYATMNLEVKQLEQQIELLKSQRRYNEANALNKELENKYYVLNLIGEKAEQASRIIENSASGVHRVVKTITEIPNLIPAGKTVRYIKNYITKQ